MAFTWTDLVDGVDEASAAPINEIGNYLKDGVPAGDISELIYEDTLTSAVSSVTISTDKDGNSFSLKFARVAIYVPAVSTADSAYMRLNNISSSVYYNTAWVTTSTMDSAFVCYPDTLFAVSDFTCNIAFGNVIMSGSMQRSTDSPSMTWDPVSCVLKDGSIAAITQFYFESTSFPIGTYIRIEGADA